MKISLLKRGSRTSALLLCSFGLIIAASAEELKVATVNMTTLLNSYHKTKAAENEDQVEKIDIKKDDAERLSAIQAMQEELRKLFNEFNDPSLSSDKKKSISKTVADRRATLAALEREREEFLRRRGRALNQKMGGLMEQIRADVFEAVNAHAATATEDVDYVFDNSGLTTSQVPFLIYVRNKIDLTGAVLAKLNKDAPKVEEAPKVETPE
ncbi:MAG: OmpH family outer membrane protein [Verrucomicrobiales bacterium]|jgi:outer membrane protein